MTTMYTADHEWINIEDHTGHLALLERAADGRQVDEHHVAQRVLRMVGDAHGGGLVVFDIDPLVVGGVHGRHGGSWGRDDKDSERESFFVSGSL